LTHDPDPLYLWLVGPLSYANGDAGLFCSVSGGFVTRLYRKLVSYSLLAVFAVASLLGEALHQVAAVSHRSSAQAGHVTCSAGHTHRVGRAERYRDGQKEVSSSSTESHEHDCLICRFLSLHKQAPVQVQVTAARRSVLGGQPAQRRFVDSARPAAYLSRAPPVYYSAT
jgi:hypothetical protein